MVSIIVINSPFSSQSMRVTRGCPICEEDVIGTAETGYYCKACNVIFSKRRVVFKHAAEEVRALVHKHFSGYGQAEAERRREERMEDRREERKVEERKRRTATSLRSEEQRASPVTEFLSLETLAGKPSQRERTATKRPETPRKTVMKTKKRTGKTAAAKPKKGARSSKRPSKR